MRPLVSAFAAHTSPISGQCQQVVYYQFNQLTPCLPDTSIRRRQAPAGQAAAYLAAVGHGGGASCPQASMSRKSTVFSQATVKTVPGWAITVLHRLLSTPKGARLRQWQAHSATPTRAAITGIANKLPDGRIADNQPKRKQLCYAGTGNVMGRHGTAPEAGKQDSRTCATAAVRKTRKSPRLTSSPRAAVEIQAWWKTRLNKEANRYSG